MTREGSDQACGVAVRDPERREGDKGDIAGANVACLLTSFVVNEEQGSRVR